MQLRVLESVLKSSEKPHSRTLFARAVVFFFQIVHSSYFKCTKLHSSKFIIITEGVDRFLSEVNESTHIVTFSEVCHSTLPL